MNDIWRLAGHGSVCDAHVVVPCSIDGSVCKHFNREYGECHCWTVFSDGRVKVCSHADVSRFCEQLAKELREVTS